MCMFEFVCITCVRVPVEAKKDVRATGTEVTGSFELLSVCAGNFTWVLKSSKCS